MQRPRPVPPAPLANPTVDSSGVPRLDEEDLRPLDPRHLTLRTLGASVGAAFGIAGAVVVGLFVASVAAGWVGVVVGVVVALASLANIVVVRRATARMGYLVRELDVTFAEGLLVRSVVTAPFARVQDVTTERGPLQRHLGLATLGVRTVGGSIRIPGLAVEEAERLKAFVSGRAGDLVDGQTPADADD